MSTESSNPFGLSSITPYLMVSNVRGLIEFLKDVFDADADSRGEPSVREDGSVMHAEIVIGDSVVMMGEPMSKIGTMPASMYLYVDDCDARYAKALSAGAASVLEPADYPHGDRYGGVKDPSGNIWWIVTHLKSSS